MIAGNRIGIHGDRSCPLLEEHIHCRNCAVYSAAATRLLDRYSLAQEHHEQFQGSVLQRDIKTRSILVFRSVKSGWGWFPVACQRSLRTKRFIRCRISVHVQCWVWPMCAALWSRAFRWSNCWGWTATR